MAPTVIIDVVKHMKKIFQIFATLAILALIAWYTADNWNSFSQISITNPWYLLVAVPAVILSIYSSGAINEIALEPHGVRISQRELLGLSSINRFAGQLAPSYVGASIRGIYFKRKYKVSYAKFSTSFAVSNVLQLIISGSIASVCYFAVHNVSLGIQSYGVILVGIALLCFVFVAPLDIVSKILMRFYKKYDKKFIKQLAELPIEFMRIRSHKGLLVKTIAWMSVMILSSGVLSYSLYGALGGNIDPLSALFIGALGSWGLVLSITPAGIGIREGIMIFSAQLIGVPVPITVVAALLQRALVSTVSGIMTAIFSRGIIAMKMQSNHDEQKS